MKQVILDADANLSIMEKLTVPRVLLQVVMDSWKFLSLIFTRMF